MLCFYQAGNLQTRATVNRALNMNFSNRCVGISNLQRGTVDVGTEIDIKMGAGMAGMYILGLHHKLEN